MSDPWADILDPELLAILRAPIKLEPVSPPSSPNPIFAPPMSRLKSTAGRGRSNTPSSNPREEPSRVNTKKTAQSRGGHRVDSVGAHQPSKPSAHPCPSTPGSPPENLLLHAIPKPGPRPKVQWYQCRSSTLPARTINKYVREFGLPEDSVDWVVPAQRANMPGGIYSAWSRYNIRPGATLPLHIYF